MFICIEGIHGSGKKTQAGRLAVRMGAKLFSFPNLDTPSGHIIHGFNKDFWRAGATSSVADVDEDALNAHLVQMLHLANKVEAIPVLEASMELGHVVSDRYWPSAYVYGVMGGMEAEYLFDLNRMLPQPDLFILLDVVGDGDLPRCYRNTWSLMSATEGSRWVTVREPGADPDEVEQEIWEAVIREGAMG